MSSEALKNAATTKENKNPVVVFSNFLDRLKPQLALALPKHLSADRMARLALTEFSTNEKLQACTPTSIAASIMAAGKMGLEIGVSGQGFLVPYKRTCTFIPGWMGLVDLVNRSGNATVYTGVIFRDQKHRFVDGARRDLEVLNETDLDEAADITHAYAIGWVKGSTMPVIELWRVSKVRKHRDKYNKVGDGHYSFRDWEMYARKVVLLQVLKYMPKSIELQRAMDANDAGERGQPYVIDGDFVTVTPGEDDDDAGGDTGAPPPAAAATTTRKPASAPPAATPPAAPAAATSTPEESARDTATSDAAAKSGDQADKGPTFTFASVNHDLVNAKSLDDLDAAASLIPSVQSGGHQKELNKVYLERRTALGGE